ncbi:pentatricopeptide repeat-containing protein At2g03380, mitochondrial-like [Selaginella moellendorffii]|uniref:pentatricopeptide repeat-containing protein At2g03380, mitochondrial-like n=1 Tax=Selaginella moellendorffii TaxID=88036 RepID=UPI000D1C7EAC|nr:pentatricopeptide repeat-containing protein At2g03380, mitochondrial-like [Selaginella moellendorffii]XP_024521352.1 pentatricopeptide repeat-containing protein At2g03380, mitochondrial-like [Selaginella moellendorffii]XP_024521353.1 pentatricopeptide repeat-containing protein At2g03380, mitochondrial-like [Selaginella moellendorffii]|eukprot:XP_024521351.1 pentatricopeptide repeat-containing protein At2g03380, mitochondrial-like [Selaginella moellendorffii]
MLHNGTRSPPPHPAEEAFAWSRLVRRCTASQSLAEGKRLHKQIAAAGMDRETVLGNLLVDMYGKCGCLDSALQVFQRIHCRNVYSWSIMIAAYARNGHYHQSIQLFRRMHHDGVRPNEFTLSIVLHACSSAGSIADGRLIHAAMDTSHVLFEYVGNALIVLYGKCGDVGSAERVFLEMQHRDPASWTAMVAAYAQNGHYRKAIDVVQKMLLGRAFLDSRAFVVIIDACAVAEDIDQGKEIHELAALSKFEELVAVANALINMYGKCGCLNEAREVFDRMPSRDVVTWTTIIVIYVQNGEPMLALDVFHQMELEPDQVTYVAVLEACGSVGALVWGREIHARLTSALDESSSSNRVFTALVKMYGQLGCVDEAEIIFGRMKCLDVVSLSAMVGVYAQGSDSIRALNLLRRMLQQGFKPNAITSISVFSACSQSGFLHEALLFYSSMEHDYGIQPTEKHVVCMVDIFAKLGWLEQAEALSKELLSWESRVIASSILLAACQVHGDADTGLQVARLVLEWDSDSAAHYVGFSNACFGCGLAAKHVKSVLFEAVSAWEEVD